MIKREITLAEFKKLPEEKLKEWFATHEDEEDVNENTFIFDADDFIEIEKWLQKGNKVTIWAKRNVEMPAFDDIINYIREGDDFAYWGEPFKFEGVDDFQKAYEAFSAAQTFQILDECVYEVLQG